MLDLFIFIIMIILAFFIFKSVRIEERILDKIKTKLDEENNIDRYKDFYYLATHTGNSLHEYLSKDLLRNKLIKDNDSKELKVLINKVIDADIVFRKKLLFVIPIILFGFITYFIS